MNSTRLKEHYVPPFTRCSSSSSSEGEVQERPAETTGDEGLQTVALLREIHGKLRLDENVLESILDPNILGNLPIAVISIAGAFRMGKSFILNFFLRYFQKKGWQLSSGSWLEGWTSTKDRGISWKGGAKGDTKGIMALQEPIVVERSNGEQLAVILLDTQGNFEHGRSREENVGIFALSTLVSSLQIFNVSKQIQTNDMEYLQCFVEFSKFVSPGVSSDVDSGERDIQKCFFQDLLFLVRDWQNPVDYPYGTDGGMNYLENLTCSDIDAQTYEYLNRAFSNIQCFLMPEPSRKVRISQWEHQSLVAKDIGKSFSKSLVDIVEKQIHPDLLKPKTLGFSGRVTARVLLHHVKCCAKKILCGERPEFPSLVKLIRANADREALEKVEKNYVDTIETVIRLMDDPSWEKFDHLLEVEKLSSRKTYLELISFGRDGRGDNLNSLHDCLRRAFPALREKMQQKRCSFMKQRIQVWLEESIEKLKFRSLPYTDINDLRKIKEECASQLPAEENRDSDSVKIEQNNAKERLVAIVDENIRDAERRNRNVTLMLTGSVVAGVSVGLPAMALCAGLCAAYFVHQNSRGGLKEERRRRGDDDGSERETKRPKRD